MRNSSGVVAETGKVRFETFLYFAPNTEGGSSQRGPGAGARSSRSNIVARCEILTQPAGGIVRVREGNRDRSKRAILIVAEAETLFGRLVGQVSRLTKLAGSSE
jgi:hypothetical protein